MEQHRIIQIVGGTSRTRAEQARMVFTLGHHAEVYADLAELFERPIGSGVILASGDLLEEGIARLVDRLGAAGIWLPVVAVAEDPGVQDVVRAIEEGALDFLALPLAQADVLRMLDKLDRAAESHVAGRRAMVEAQRRIATLSRRERQVLDWLAEGYSNKLIARALDISPRTVEIHRANMMVKLAVQHSAEAVRLQCIACLQSTAGKLEAAEAYEAAAPFRPVSAPVPGPVPVLVPAARADRLATPLRRAA